MKYKVGDKVRINKNSYFDMVQKSFYEKNNYTLTIKSYRGSHYYMEEDDIFCYPDYCIDGLYFIPIYSRWELLDIR